MSNKKEGDNVNFWLPMAQNNIKTDSLTPHKIATIFLIQEYLEIKQEVAENKFEYLPFLPIFRKKFHLLLIKLIQYPDLPYRDLFTLISSEQYAIHPQHLHRFQTIMLDIARNDNGMESLFELQSMTDKLMSEQPNKNGGVSQSGLVGLYLRRVHVTLDKMSFSEILVLYKNIKKYVERGIRALVIAPVINIDETEINLLKGSYKERASQCKWSMKQAELFVAQQSQLLLNDETQAMTPKELQSKLCEIMQDNPLYSQAYFLCYLNSVRLRDYFNALDALKRAFDRSTLKSLTTATNENKGYQFSCLNLAILHAQFGHSGEAIQSLKECIMLAQENGDRMCLDLAQSWLCYLQEGNTQMPDTNVNSKSDTTIAINASVACQTLIKKSSNNGSTPSRLFEILMRSDVLNCQHSLMNLKATGMSERAALWNLYGKNELAACCSQVMLHTNLRHLGKTYNSDGICEAICTNALWLGLQGEYNLSAIVLQHAKDRFPRYPLARFWIITDCYITSIQGVITGKWQECEEACNNLYRLDYHLAILQKASLNIARRNLKAAQKWLQELLDNDHLEKSVRVKGLVLLANTMFLGNGTVLPEAINLLNEAHVLATKNYFTYEIAMIDAHFSHILLTLNMPQRALKSIKGALEAVLVNGSLYDKARITFLFVKCLLASVTEKEQKISKLNEVDNLLEQAVKDFTRLECHTKVKDIYIYLAEMYHNLKMFDDRNRYAYKFRVLEQQYPTSSEYLNIFH